MRAFGTDEGRASPNLRWDAEGPQWLSEDGPLLYVLRASMQEDKFTVHGDSPGHVL